MKMKVETSAQVAKVYHVEVGDDLKPDEQKSLAHKRLRNFLADPGMVAEGIVEEVGERNVTEPKVQVASIEKIAEAPTNEGKVT